MQGKWGLRAVALLAVGALALHELSYWLTDGVSGVGGHSHSYMPLAAGVVTVLLLLACASFARTMIRAMRGIEDEGHPPSFYALWPLLSAALLGAFALQEWVEGWVTPGHPGGVGHVAGHIGPGGVGLAIAISALIALLLRRRPVRGCGGCAPAPRAPGPPRPPCAHRLCVFLRTASRRAGRQPRRPRAAGSPPSRQNGRTAGAAAIARQEEVVSMGRTGRISTFACCW